MRTILSQLTPLFLLVPLLLFTGALRAQTNVPPVSEPFYFLVVIQGTVEVARGANAPFSLAPTNQSQILYPGYRIRTGERSRASIYCSEQLVTSMDETSDFVLPPAQGANFRKGWFRLFERQRGIKSTFGLPGATAAIRGTDFVIHITEDGQTEFTVLDGEVILSNPLGQLVITNGQKAFIAQNAPPVPAPRLEADNDLIAWSLYYPGILDVDELPFDDAEKQALAAAIDAYRNGDLLEAVGRYSWERQGLSDTEKSFRAGLLLAVGRVKEAQAILDTQQNATKSGRALRQLIAAVKFQPWDPGVTAQSAAEEMALSYYKQSQSRLPEALTAAKAAVERSTNFGFGWARVAELEFSFGRTHEALLAVNRSLQLSPRNVNAVALKGFFSAARNDIKGAIVYFDRAIALDGAFANAWLGRGLCRIRQGQDVAGRADLLIAAALEPQRSVLRSYLGKSFGDAGDIERAEKEFKLARELDPNDPTGWLYSALLKQQKNRINEAISDLQESQKRNNNRSLFRSRLLLDQDRAVSSANLASIYRDAGMTEVSVREASRAVTYDYANPSAHLFLSDAYNDLRDPTRFNLRYETVWFNELLLANVLAPVGAGRLSQEVSAQEYSRLFEADGLGFASATDVRSDGSIHELASQFGQFGNMAYALDLDYRHQDGIRPNNSLNSIEWYTTIKQQVTPQDTVLLLTKYENYHSGDNFQYYDPRQARKDFKFDEYQEPILVGAWHHQWAPGIHTLLLIGRLINEQRFRDRSAGQLVVAKLADGSIDSLLRAPYDVNYRSEFEIYSAELNQICAWERVSLTAGGRYQAGTFRTQDEFTNGVPSGLFVSTAGSARDHFDRITGFAYATVQPLPRLWLTAGLAYDQLAFPENFRTPPIAAGGDRRSHLGPKAALVWNPLNNATVRGIYARSIGGVSLDESYRLEPTQLAGFPQAFRSLISESRVGSVSAPTYETVGVALDLKLGPRTYVNLQAERLESTVHRKIGIFVLQNGVVRDSTREHLDYNEHALTLSLNRLIGKQVAVGTSYRFIQAELDDTLPEIPVSAASEARLEERAHLHRISGYVLWNHPSGLFARTDAHWYSQHNSGYSPAIPGDDFYQVNAFAGYRFAERRMELRLGLLNLTGQNYRLNPLTVYEELPRRFLVETSFSLVF